MARSSDASQTRTPVPRSGNPDPSPVGLIGLGLMGSAMAERLLARGFDVVGFDVAPDNRAAWVNMGGRFVTDVGELASSCQRLLLSLPDSDVVQSVLGQIQPHLRPGQVVIDTTTGSPEAAVEVGHRLEKLKVSYFEATISGNSTQVRQGAVMIMTGGSADVIASCTDLLESFASNVLHCGDWGSASRMKLVTNLVLGLNRAVLAEGLVFAESLGLQPGPALTALRASMGYSRIMDTKGDKMVAGDFEPQARLSQHLKDVRLMLDAAADAGQRLPLSETHRDLLEFAERLGLGALDNAAILRAFEAQRVRPEPR